PVRLRRLRRHDAPQPRAARRGADPGRAAHPARPLGHGSRRDAGPGLAGRRPLRLDAALMPDPVSWMMIEQGWAVIDADGDEVGRVDEVLGEEGADIFNGLQVLTGTLGK